MPLTGVPLDSIEERLRHLPLHAGDQLSGMTIPLPGDLLDMRQLRRAIEGMVHLKRHGHQLRVTEPPATSQRRFGLSPK